MFVKAYLDPASAKVVIREILLRLLLALNMVLKRLAGMDILPDILDKCVSEGFTGIQVPLQEIIFL